ncbi:MAG: MFS transporter [Anaerolineae bacterium]|nr:MFS transporter [Anaerolineae bacterium]
MSARSQLPPDYRRNFAALLGDFFFFGVASSFLNQTTVLPSLVRQLTSSAPLVGLVATLQNGGWLLPQLIVANYVASKPLKKRYILIPAAIGRLSYPLLALVIWQLAIPHPDVALAVFFLVITFFAVSDGLASVPWFDVLSKSLSPELRGRLVGIAQMSTGIASVLVGVVVHRILGPEGPPFPDNYALLFAIASGSFFLSLLSISSLREHPGKVSQERPSWRAFMARLVQVVREHKAFRLVIITRLLIRWGDMAAPFYVVYALDVLHFDQGAVGLFISAQVIGGIISGLVMGYVAEHEGTRKIIRISGWLAVGTPLLALGIPMLRPLSPAGLLPYLYALVFAAMGALMNANMAGFMNYILEIAPETERPAYVGLANTLGSLILLAPFLGGWVLEAFSYGVLLTVTAMVCLAGLIVSRWLEEPRQRRMATASA